MFQTTNQIRIVLSKLRCDTPRIWLSHQNCWCNKPKMIWPIVQENMGIFPTDWILPTKTDIGNTDPWEWQQNCVASTWHSHVNHGRLCWSKTKWLESILCYNRDSNFRGQVALLLTSYISWSPSLEKPMFSPGVGAKNPMRNLSLALGSWTMLDPLDPLKLGKLPETAGISKRMGEIFFRCKNPKL